MLDSSQFLLRALIADRVVTERDAERAAKHAPTKGLSVLDALVDLGIVTARRLAICRAKICEHPYVDVNAFEIDIRHASLLPRAMAEKLGVFPLFCLDGVATLGMLDPLNLQVIDQVRQHLKTDVDPVICDAEHLRALIARAYSLSSGHDEAAAAKKAAPETLTTGDEPIVAAVNQIIGGAIAAGASDIHINPDEGELHLRYRIDGVLHRQQGPPISVHPGLVQRIKVMSDLDLTQSRKPQDGKFRFTHRGQVVDIRVSVVPTVCGENVVMRLLRATASIWTIQDLGMQPEMAAQYEDAIHRPYGMVLATGPTGSGKTTTLYTALSALNSPDRNIVTIEDPVEIRLPMVRQVQVNAEIGLTFAAALRSILRQDPNVVLLGEIRDQETARIAVQAAMTGHLVLSTLHTNDAVGAIPRLLDFGVPTFGVNQALLCVIAQRLVRRVCGDCARPEMPDPGTLENLHLSSADAGGFRKGAGCAVCHSSGYRGRVGVYELLRITTRVQRLVDRAATVHEIEAAATADGMRRMWYDGLDKARAGLTTVTELNKLRAATEIETTGDFMRMSA